MKPSFLAVALLYAIAGFLTYGHVFNSLYAEPGECGTRPNSIEEPSAYSRWLDCTFPPFATTTVGAFYPALAAGAIWPVYWTARGSIWVTK